ncbi:MAG: DNA glycosylase [Puniceicoccaceae bacterium]
MSGTSWGILPGPPSFDPRTLAETLIGGQAFRWYHEPDSDTWIGVWDSNVIRLRLEAQGQVAVRSLTKTSPEEVCHYLGTDRLESLIATLPCNADPVLDNLRRRWSGLSILRQPPGEALLAFICSSNKQILQIRSMLHQLSVRFGDPIEGTAFNSLPTWERLAQIEEEALRSCALGYRARHVAGTAAFLSEHPGYLQSIHPLPLEEARSALLKLSGVGPKVADCILLFGYGRMEAFPVDTWIARLMVEHYPELAGWKREQVATFARLHFGQAAGLAQQWLFAERNKDLPIRYSQYQIPRDAD